LNFAASETLHPKVVVSSTETFLAKLIQVSHIFNTKKIPKKLRHFRDLQKAFGIPKYSDNSYLSSPTRAFLKTENRMSLRRM
jgi:hypothetical protein